MRGGCVRNRTITDSTGEFQPVAAMLNFVFSPPPVLFSRYHCLAWKKKNPIAHLAAINNTTQERHWSRYPKRETVATFSRRVVAMIANPLAQQLLEHLAYSVNPVHSLVACRPASLMIFTPHRRRSCTKFAEYEQNTSRIAFLRGSGSSSCRLRCGIEQTTSSRVVLLSGVDSITCRDTSTGEPVDMCRPRVPADDDVPSSNASSNEFLTLHAGYFK